MNFIKYTIVVLGFLCSNALFAQEIPKKIEEDAQKEYRTFSKHMLDELGLTMDEYVQKRRDEYALSQNFYRRIASQRAVTNLCDNGTFESGDINVGDWHFFWSGQQGAQSGTNRVNTGSFNSGGPHGSQVHHQVQSVGPDPSFPALNKVYSFPIGNSKSLRIGNANSGCGSESVAKQITITPANAQLSFSYAMVMDNPSGHGNALPFFEVNIINSANTTQNFNHLINLGNGSNRISSDNPLLIPNSTTAPRRWKDWTCVTADLSSIIGQTVIIEFKNRDCWACAHWSYTYIDNICVSCTGAPSEEGSVSLNIEQTDDCEIPGQICVDYTLPNGNNPALSIGLELIQNGNVVTTLNSPTLTSGSNYCFNLTVANTSGLNTSLAGFDYRIIGTPSIGTFTLTPIVIGTSVNGMSGAQNDDYFFRCFSGKDCCETKLDISTRFDSITPLPIKPAIVSGQPVSIAEQTFTINNSSAIPLSELRVVMTDLQFTYNYNACAECIDNPALWGSLFTSTQSIGGGTTGSLTLNGQSYGSTNPPSVVNANQVVRELIWKNPNGAFLQPGNSFNVQYLLPPISEIPCCATHAKVCIKISWKDANCKLCEEYHCAVIEIKK